MPVPPKDAQYTIYCQVLAGPGHVERSRQLRQALRQNASMKNWYIIHAADQSTLYYGFYRTVNPRDPKDAAEGKRALTDLNAIKSMVDANGYRPFGASVPVPIDSPDPAANPAWDLARTNGYWTVEIALYKDSPDRKQAAVDSVRAARAQGIEAYYYHGPTASSVCIGCWPSEAVREIDPAAQNNNPNEPILITPTPMSEQAAREFEAQGLKAVAPQLEYTDPTLVDTLRRYPEHAVNGEVHVRQSIDPATGQTKREADHSVPVKIVHRDVAPDMPSRYVEGGAPAQAVHDQAPPPGVGRLRSIGE